jgi:hypothetical protein
MDAQQGRDPHSDKVESGCRDGRLGASHAVTSTPQRPCRPSGLPFLLPGSLRGGLLPRLLPSNSSVSVLWTHTPLFQKRYPFSFYFPFSSLSFLVFLPPCPNHTVSIRPTLPVFNTPRPSPISREIPFIFCLIIPLIRIYSTALRLPISDSPDPMFSPQETPTPKFLSLFKSKTHPPLITPPLTPSSSIASGSSGAANSSDEPDRDAPVPPSRFLMVSNGTVVSSLH